MHTPQDLCRAVEAAFARQFALLDSLSDPQLALPYHPGINPPLWEGGHAAFFYEAFLLRPLFGQPPLMPGFDPIWDSFDIDHEDRWLPGVVPDRATTRAYMTAMHDQLLQRLDQAEPSPDLIYRVRYGVAHQYMHAESMLWARQTLGLPGLEFLQDAPAPAPAGDVEIPPGRHAIGMPGGEAARSAFAFDNEKPGFELELPAFRIASRPVTCGEFLAFVADGGYRTPALWSWGGQKWLRARAAKDRDMTRPHADGSQPLYWRWEDGQWQQRLFDRWEPLPRDEPVGHISYWEAEAYCAWAGRRLPSEFEWEAAAKALGFPLPGPAWEWTHSPFLPYPGFTHDMYPYMSTLQFGYHKVCKGGSRATAPGLIRPSYRQAYLPERRDVFVGFRTCAR